MIQMYVYAIPTNGDPGCPVAGPFTNRAAALAAQARFTRENDASMNYVVRFKD
jgi:hypothetical protein